MMKKKNLYHSQETTNDELIHMITCIVLILYRGVMQLYTLYSSVYIVVCSYSDSH